MVKKEKKLVCGVGRYTVGKYPGNIDGAPGKHYGRWASMLNRCYNPAILARQPTYAGCTADNLFHDFQEFMLWAEQQIGFDLEGYQLDKDILFRDNKVYSPDTCVFLPRRLNSILLRRQGDRGSTLIGVSKHKSNGRYNAHLKVSGKLVHLGAFGTELEAFHAYKEAKEANIARMAEEYRDVISVAAYEALIKYEVLVTD